MNAPSFIRLPAPWTNHQGSFAVLASLACLPLGGCIFVAGGGNLKHESRDQMTLTEAAGARKLILRNHVGDVIITAEPTATEITATATMIGRGRTPEAAEEALEEIVVTLDPSKSDTTIIEAIASHPSGSNRKNYLVEWRITAPPALEVEVRNEVGDIDLRGFTGPAFIQNDVGDFNAVQLTQGLTIVNGVGDIDAKASGPIDLKTDVGDATINVLAGDPRAIKVTTDVGEISLALPEQWTGTLDAQTDTGDVEVSLPGMPVSFTRQRNQRATGSIGTGEATITLSSDVGDIEITRAN